MNSSLDVTGAAPSSTRKIPEPVLASDFRGAKLACKKIYSLLLTIYWTRLALDLADVGLQISTSTGYVNTLTDLRMQPARSMRSMCSNCKR